MVSKKSLDISFNNKTNNDIEITEIWADRGRIGELQDLSFPIAVSSNTSKEIKYVNSDFEYSYSLKFKANDKSYRIPRLTEGNVVVYFDEESQKYSAAQYVDTILGLEGESYDVIECE